MRWGTKTSSDFWPLSQFNKAQKLPFHCKGITLGAGVKLSGGCWGGPWEKWPGAAPCRVHTFPAGGRSGREEWLWTDRKPPVLTPHTAWEVENGEWSSEVEHGKGGVERCWFNVCHFFSPYCILIGNKLKLIFPQSSLFCPKHYLVGDLPSLSQPTSSLVHGFSFYFLPPAHRRVWSEQLGESLAVSHG